MKDYSKNKFVQRVRADYRMWINGEDELISYDEMPNDQLLNTIDLIEKKKIAFEEIIDEFENKINEIIKFLDEERGIKYEKD